MKVFGEYTITSKDIDDMVPQGLYEELEPATDDNPNIGFRLDDADMSEGSCLWRLIEL